MISAVHGARRTTSRPGPGLTEEHPVTLGPVDVVIVEFPGNQFTGELAPMLRDLVAAGTIRVIDLIFVTKDAEGDVAMLEIAGLDDSLVAAFTELEIGVGTGMLDDDDVEMVADALAPNSSAALLVWENTWAAPFVAALGRANARVVDQVRIPADVVQAQLAAAGLDG
jgi:hypothetical protein